MKPIHCKDHEDSCPRPRANLPTVGQDAEAYQRQSLRALLELFLRAQGAPLPEHSQLKSASASSRFFTVYAWSVRQVICHVRAAICQALQRYQPRGRRPHLQVILNMTILEKRGKLKAFSDLITVFYGKRGVYLVVLYLVPALGECLELLRLPGQRPTFCRPTGVDPGAAVVLIAEMRLQTSDSGQYYLRQCGLSSGHLLVEFTSVCWGAL